VTGHTPGPWAIVGRYGNYKDEIAGPDGDAIAAVWTRKAYPKASDPHDDPEGKANARLISAAPDLYEALKTCLRAEGNLPPATVAAALAAIAKAEGR
jgi:hypothetical protein